MNRLLDPFEAQQNYPDAWQRIEEEMQEARDGYAATLVPVVAEVIDVEGEQMLHVVALSDVNIAEDCEDDTLARMTFHAKLAPF